MILRRPFLALGTMKNQLKGIGGPGAPHCFRLDRMKDLGHVLSQMNVFLIPADFFSSTFMKHMRNTFQNNQGLRHDQVDTKFWRGRGVTFSEDDVVLRTSGVDPSRVDCCYIAKSKLIFQGQSNIYQMDLGLTRFSCICPPALPKACLAHHHQAVSVSCVICVCIHVSTLLTCAVQFNEYMNAESKEANQMRKYAAILRSWSKIKLLIILLKN